MRKLMFAVLIVIVGFTAIGAFAQTTEFTFQGSLKDGSNPANGSYDFEFALFDTLTAGTQAGPTLSRNGVAVTAGSFSVKLDFGNQYPGTNRFIEIRVRPAGQPGITTLAPRQQLGSSPYSAKSLNADNAATAGNSLQLGGVAANQYVVTTDPRLSDARLPLPGGTGYVQNTTTQQASSNFSISGNGTAGGNLNASVVNATLNYQIAGVRILAAPGGTGNLFAGEAAGNSNQTGLGNSFFGSQSGQENTLGNENSYFGSGAGKQGTTAAANSIFGFSAGSAGSAGSENSFFGHSAGKSNNSNQNSFFGAFAGENNFVGTRNSFFGYSSGRTNTTGNDNAFFGYQSGLTNDTGIRNSFFGSEAGKAADGTAGNSFFGFQSGTANTTGYSNSIFGALAGPVSTTGTYNSFFGVSSGQSNTVGSNNAFFGYLAGAANVSGNLNTLIGSGANVSSPSLTYASAIGADSVVSSSNTVVLGRAADTVKVPGILNAAGTSLLNGNVIAGGTVSVATLGSAGSTALCRNASNVIATCSSSLKYKTSVSGFTDGLSIVRKLRPITFSWRDGGMKDVGFAAEEVNAVEPLLTTYNDRGEIEGVKYAQITTVLVNAVTEQDKKITEQQKEIELLKKQLAAMTQVICRLASEKSLCL